jgi:hypothetical protein
MSAARLEAIAARLDVLCGERAGAPVRLAAEVFRAGGPPEATAAILRACGETARIARIVPGGSEAAELWQETADLLRAAEAQRKPVGGRIGAAETLP